MSKPKKTTKQLQLLGYTKQEKDGRFVSICVNLSLSAQGKTPDESLKKLFKAVDIYLDHVAKNHMDRWDEFTNRWAHPDLLEEFKAAAESLIELAERAEENARNKDYSKFPGVYPFVKPLSTTYTKTGMQNT